MFPHTCIESTFFCCNKSLFWLPVIFCGYSRRNPSFSNQDFCFLIAGVLSPKSHGLFQQLVYIFWKYKWCISYWFVLYIVTLNVPYSDFNWVFFYLLFTCTDTYWKWLAPLLLSRLHHPLLLSDTRLPIAVLPVLWLLALSVNFHWSGVQPDEAWRKCKSMLIMNQCFKFVTFKIIWYLNILWHFHSKCIIPM